MNVLLIVNTPFQLFNAINLRLNVLEESDMVDIVLSDHSKVSNYYESLQNEKIFNNVYSAKTLKLARKFYFLKDKKKEKVLTKPQKILSKILKINYKMYDKIFFANIDGFAKVLFREAFQTETRFCYFEDGFASYILDFANYGISPYEKYFNEVLNEEIIQKNISEIWVYQPDLFSGTAQEGCNICKIPNIDKTDSTIKNLFNRVFKYKEQKEYSINNIFLEEAFCEDGFVNNDREIIECLASYFGKDNFLIKRHPRVSMDRWSKDNYVATNDFSIPWEVLLFNIDFSNKCVLTIQSNACMTPQMVFGETVPVFYLRKCLVGGVSSTYRRKEFDVFLKKYLEKFGDYFYMVNNVDDIDESYKKYLHDKQIECCINV